MSKVLSVQEAEQIVESMLKPVGFNVTVLHHDKHADVDSSHQLCNSDTVTKTVGSLWWKKTVTTTKLTPVFTGWCWEDVIDQLDKWLKTKVEPRIALADKFREQQAHYLLDKKLQE